MEKIINTLEQHDLVFLGTELDNSNNKVIVYKFKSKDNYCIFAMYEKEGKNQWNDPFSCDAAILTFEAKSQVYNNKCIHIGDIRGHKHNRGLGSILIKYLKSYCLSEGIIEIVGDISDNPEGLRNFYRKHNFKVKIDERNGVGTVRWVKWYDLETKRVKL